MNAHSAAPHPVQDAALLGVSSMASMFSGTMAGLTAIATDAPARQHLVQGTCHHLDGIGMILESQVVMVENLAKRIHCKREIIASDYLDPSGEIETTCKQNVVHLHTFITQLDKGNQSIDFDPAIGAHQRSQLHAAYQRVIALSHRAIEALETLAGVVVTHDLDAEPPSEHPWDNLDDMLAVLQAQAA